MKIKTVKFIIISLVRLYKSCIILEPIHLLYVSLFLINLNILFYEHLCR